MGYIGAAIYFAGSLVLSGGIYLALPKRIKEKIKNGL